MPYLNLDLDFFDHPKTKRLIAILGPTAPQLILKLWCHAGKYHAKNGRLDGYSENEIEGLAGWSGEPGKMVEAMKKPGINFLEKSSNVYKIHDWEEHAGHLAAFKKRAKSAAYKRWNRYATSNAPSMQNDDFSNTPNLPNLPNLPNQPNQEYTDSECPVFVQPEKIVERWNLIPGVKPVTKLGEGLRKRIVLRAKNHDEAWWIETFDRIAKSDFLCNRLGKDWCATLEWCLGPKNLEKIESGNYDNITKSKPDPRKPKVVL